MRRYLEQIGCILRPGSVNNTDQALRAFAGFLLGSAPEVRLDQLTRRHIEDYKLWLAKRPGQNWQPGTPVADSFAGACRSWRMLNMTGATGDFELSVDELRVVTRYAAESAQDVLALFEARSPEDTALDAHRAAKEVDSDVARHGAQAAGDAAAAAYLHPLANATQVGHILRAAANAARAAELSAGGDPLAGDVRIEKARQRATPILIDVLRRYPEAPTGKSRVAQLMKALDRSLRALR